MLAESSLIPLTLDGLRFVEEVVVEDSVSSSLTPLTLDGLRFVVEVVVDDAVSSSRIPLTLDGLRFVEVVVEDVSVSLSGRVDLLDSSADSSSVLIPLTLLGFFFAGASSSEGSISSVSADFTALKASLLVSEASLLTRALSVEGSLCVSCSTVNSSVPSTISGSSFQSSSSSVNSESESCSRYSSSSTSSSQSSSSSRSMKSSSIISSECSMYSSSSKYSVSSSSTSSLTSFRAYLECTFGFSSSTSLAGGVYPMLMNSLLQVSSLFLFVFSLP